MFRSQVEKEERDKQPVEQEVCVCSEYNSIEKAFNKCHCDLSLSCEILLVRQTFKFLSAFGMCGIMNKSPSQIENTFIGTSISF